MKRWLIVLVVLLAGLAGCTLVVDLYHVVVPRAAVTYVASNTGNDAAGTPCTDAQPCSVRRGLITMSCSNNDVLELLGSAATPSIYQGANYMLDLNAHVPGKSGSDNTHRCTVRARNDGGVVIDGQYARNAVVIHGHSWWTFQGFDAAHGTTASNTNSVMNINGYNDGTFSTGLVFQRICAYDAGPNLVGENGHVWIVINSFQGTYEDLCGFGIGGRNMFLTEYTDGGVSGGQTNTYRRIWARHDGYKGTNVDAGMRSCQANVVQLGYHDREPYNSIYENLIFIHSYDQLPTSDPCYSPTAPIRTGDEWLFAGEGGKQMYGLIGYTSSPVFFALDQAGFWLRPLCDRDVNPRTLKDIFIDVRNHKIAPFYLENQLTPPLCMSADRLTALKTSAADGDSWSPQGNHNVFINITVTNVNECTTPGACPDFYTGTLGGASGARNCFEYTNGVLGSTTATQALWPWRMDNRIKAALARAGKTALAGGAGSGYAAGTVTSEIVSRYGAVPPGCNRTGSVFVPDFPVVTDFPATPVIDAFDRAPGGLGANWTNINGSGAGLQIAGNQVSATDGNYPRVLWNAATMTPQQEAYGTWTTVPPDGSTSVVLLVGATTTDDLTGWQLQLERQASANDRLLLVRLTGGYAQIWGPIDLGTEVLDGNLFGLRVSALQTISVYWKYNGVTYRVGSVIDTALPSGSTMSMIGFGGGSASGAVINDFGGGSTGGVAPNPGSIGRFGSRIPTQ